MKYTWIKLSHLLQQYKNQIDINPDTIYGQITVSNTGEVKIRGKKYGVNIGTKKQNLVQGGLFIYSRLGVHTGSFGIIPKELEGSIVTSDMPIFKINQKLVEPNLLIHIIKSNSFEEKLKKLTKGAAQVRVRENVFLNLEIPLPERKFQQNLLIKLNNIEKKTNSILQLLNYEKNTTINFRISALIYAFSGKLTKQNKGKNSALELYSQIQSVKKNKTIEKINTIVKPYPIPPNWIWCRLEHIGFLQRGKSKHRPRNDPHLFINGIYPFVQTGDVARSNGGLINTYTSKYNNVGLSQSKIWKKGTLCITIAANIAETGFLGFDACFPDSVVGFTSFIDDDILRYVNFFIQYSKKNLEKFAPSTAQKNINLGILNKLLIPLPPLTELKRIIEILEKLTYKIEQIDKTNEQIGKKIKFLTEAILQKELN